jgi:hypothetical protein
VDTGFSFSSSSRSTFLRIEWEFRGARLVGVEVKEPGVEGEPFVTSDSLELRRVWWRTTLAFEVFFGELELRTTSYLLWEAESGVVKKLVSYSSSAAMKVKNSLSSFVS